MLSYMSFWPDAANSFQNKITGSASWSLSGFNTTQYSEFISTASSRVTSSVIGTRTNATTYSSTSNTNGISTYLTESSTTSSTSSSGSTALTTYTQLTPTTGTSTGETVSPVTFTISAQAFYYSTTTDVSDASTITITQQKTSSTTRSSVSWGTSPSTYSFGLIMDTTTTLSQGIPYLADTVFWTGGYPRDNTDIVWIPNSTNLLAVVGFITDLCVSHDDGFTIHASDYFSSSSTALTTSSTTFSTASTGTTFSATTLTFHRTTTRSTTLATSGQFVIGNRTISTGTLRFTDFTTTTVNQASTTFSVVAALMSSYTDSGTSIRTTPVELVSTFAQGLIVDGPFGGFRSTVKMGSRAVTGTTTESFSFSHSSWRESSFFGYSIYNSGNSRGKGGATTAWTQWWPAILRWFPHTIASFVGATGAEGMPGVNTAGEPTAVARTAQTDLDAVFGGLAFGLNISNMAAHGSFDDSFGSDWNYGSGGASVLIPAPNLTDIVNVWSGSVFYSEGTVSFGTNTNTSSMEVTFGILSGTSSVTGTGKITFNPAIPFANLSGHQSTEGMVNWGGRQFVSAGIMSAFFGSGALRSTAVDSSGGSTSGTESRTWTVSSTAGTSRLFFESNITATATATTTDYPGGLVDGTVSFVPKFQTENIGDYADVTMPMPAIF